MAHDAAQGTLEVVHHIPGRLRVRVPPAVRATDLSDAAAALPGVTSVSWSPRTRGLLVLYDRERADESAIVAALAQHAQVEVTRPTHPGANGQRPTLAAIVASLFGEVDAREHEDDVGVAQAAERSAHDPGQTDDFGFKRTECAG